MPWTSQAREAESDVSSPPRMPGHVNADETALATPPQMEPAQRAPAEATSTEPHGAVEDFAARWRDLPKTPELDATINNSHTEKHEPMDAHEEMPLIWPILTEAERAELPDSARKSSLRLAFLAVALAMVLLCAGAIFKLARQHAQSYRRDHSRVVPGRPRPAHRGPPDSARSLHSSRERIATSILQPYADRPGAGAHDFENASRVDPARNRYRMAQA
jgi:hypothetical protein